MKNQVTSNPVNNIITSDPLTLQLSNPNPNLKSTPHLNLEPSADPKPNCELIRVN